VLQALLGSIQHVHEIKPRLVQRKGNVAEAIIRVSIEEHSDLIVMGTHGASGYRDGFVGSTTYSVMKYAECPVLSIPPKRKFSCFTRAVFPIRPVSGALARYDVLCHFLGRHSKVDVLGLSYRKMERGTRVLEKIVEEIGRQIEADGVDVNTAWGGGEGISEDVLHHAQQSLNDLIVVTSLLDVANKPGFIGPHTQKIIHSARIPVLSTKGVGVPSYA